ncbi:MAG: hypothetical protein RIC35_15745 [Marinoscillum sp.]
MENFAIKKCLTCGKTLTGQSDKKFCDAYCRNSFNNLYKAADEQYIQQVSSLIRHNRRILKDLCPEGKSTVRKEVLDIRGFDYKYFSGIFSSAKLTYYICYDYAFAAVIEKGKEKALIIQK